MRILFAFMLTLAATEGVSQQADNRCEIQEKALAHAYSQYWLATEPMDVPYGDPYIVRLGVAVSDAQWERNRCIDAPELAKKAAWPLLPGEITTTGAKQ